MIAYLLDTDHLSVLERGGEPALPLQTRLAAVDPTTVAATIISYEEQTRGWFAYLAKARTVGEQLIVYAYLQRHLQMFCRIPLVGFDQAAADHFLTLQRIRVGTMDRKIAAIALALDATLLTRNLTDFAHIPKLRIADWTASATP